MNDVYLNRKLKQLFGELNGKQIFRLARTDQTEYRKGTFTDFSEDGMYLRTVTEVRLTRKYNYLKTHYWVLEKLMPVSGPNAEMLPGRNVSYEPIYVFRRPDDTPMTISEDAVLSFVHLQLFGEKKKRDLVQEELDHYERQVDFIHQYLKDECSVMSMQLHTGEAIVNPKDNTNGRRDVSVVSSPRDSGVQAGATGTARNDSSSPDE
jgi:hypothetical protein